MNRIVAFILIIIYITFTTGLVVNVHYCMGQVASVKIETAAAQDACSKCGKKAAMNCCNDELTVLKVNDSHNTAINNIRLQAPVLFLAAILHNNFISSLHNSGADIVYTTHSPPMHDSPDIYLLNENFRI